MRHYLEGLLKQLPEKPKAILLVTAHWEESAPTLSTATAPPMYYDYYGFPEHTYRLQYPAPGAPDVAERARSLLQKAGIETAVDESRGYDHGVFVPMLIVDPEAKIPVVMMSLQHDLDAAEHIAIGKALAPLRDEGILIIGSGSSYHNLRKFFDDQTNEVSLAFDTWLNEIVTAINAGARNRNLSNWEQAPFARICHPREEHLLPLMVASGAGGEDQGRRTLSTRIRGKAVSCFAFG